MLPQQPIAGIAIHGSGDRKPLLRDLAARASTHLRIAPYRLE